ncbi:MAG TPA: hypothetical protein VN814_13465 [Caulobacteraceae bacterium]|nr:hypothetical protein [Caulobacteraceae bacterium]
MDDDPFESPKLLLDRAKEHLADFAKRESAFFDRQPYTQFIDKEANPGWDTYVIRFTAKVPGSLATVCADVVNNLRHSLDQALCASVLALTGKMPRDTYFPFGENAEDLERRIANVCKRVAPEVVNFIRGLHPHRGANTPNLLWAMNKISGANKHRVLSPMATSSTGVVQVKSFEGFGTTGVPLGKWNSEKNELEAAMLRPGIKPNYSLQFSMFVALYNEDSQLSGPAAGILSLMGGFTKEALDGIESETHKLLGSRP